MLYPLSYEGERPKCSGHVNDHAMPGLVSRHEPRASPRRRHPVALEFLEQGRNTRMRTALAQTMQNDDRRIRQVAVEDMLKRRPNRLQQWRFPPRNHRSA